MLDRIYNYFNGFVTVRLRCKQPERFLNLAVMDNIYLWDLKRISENEITFNVSKKGFKKLRKTVYEVKARAKILKKRGFYILLKRIRRKRLMAFAFIPFIIIIIFLSSLILNIEIVGNETIPEEVILEKLREIDLQKFKFRSNIDSEEVSLKLINDLDNISWVGVYEKGTKLLIEIKERRLPPPMIPLDVPCHIVAGKDGIIKRMNVKNGEPLTSLNQVVTKGQVLVSGILDTKFDGLRYVHSMADIVASTWQENFLSVKLYEYKKNYTDNKTGKIFLKIFSKEFDLTPLKDIPYYNYDESVKRYIFGFLEVDIKTYSEYTLFKSPLTEEEAIKRGKEALLDDLYKDYKKESVKSTEFSKTVIDEETVNLKLFARMEEEIGRELIIERNN